MNNSGSGAGKEILDSFKSLLKGFLGIIERNLDVQAEIVEFIPLFGPWLKEAVEGLKSLVERSEPK